jgi:pimeloyl-ACP methyl ester carboxylesterase
MFRSQLTTVQKTPDSPPNLHGNYALTVLHRILYYRNQALLESWGAWAGATSVQQLSTGINIFSDSALFSDGQELIWCFEGTKRWEQVYAEIVASSAIPNPLISGWAHAFFLYNFIAQLATYQDALSAFPVTTPITLTGHSLGGAVAMIAANHFEKTLQLFVNGVLSTGQPRVGTEEFNLGITCPYVRWINENDPIPDLPPHPSIALRFLPWSLPLGVTFLYFHKGLAWRLYENLGYDQGENFIFSAPYPGVLPNFAVPHWLAQQGLEFHPVKAYLRRMRGNLNMQTAPWSPEPLFAMESQMDALDEGITLPVDDGEDVPPLAVWIDPNTIMPTDGSMPTVPLADVGRTIEQRSVAHTLYFFGGTDFMAHKFRGKDRRLIKAAYQSLTDIMKRDVRATNPKKTRALSNRTLMFPSTEMGLGGETLLEAITDVQKQLTVLYRQ